MIKTKIEDTKNVHEFKEMLCEEFVNKVYAECFEGHEPFSKAQMLTQGRIAIRLAYNHIRNKYVKQERKKYNAIIDDYERYLQRHMEQEQKMKQKISSLQSENEKLDNFNDELRRNYENCVNYWKKENAKLQEQLKMEQK